MSIALFSAFLTYTLLPFYKSFLRLIGSVDYNYQNKQIPTGFGGLFFFVEVLLLLLFPQTEIESLWVYLLIITIIGTYDDLFGEKKIKGLKGHIKAFFNYKITSGFLKAVTGGLVALFLGFYLGKNIINSLIHFLLILLMINALNLFDLRPGRAAKVFFLLFFVLSISTAFLAESNPALIVIGIMIIVFFQDVHAKIMIGDSGANLLGLHLGIWYSLYLPVQLQLVLIIMLAYLHYYAERKSLSYFIEKNKLLKKIDLLGQKIK